MSSLIIQVGQCGNQIGCKIFNNLIEEMKNSSECLLQLIADTYFTVDEKDQLNANGIMIDMEAKVIEKCLKISSNKGWNYVKDSIINKQEGSGNNWANGFFNHGPSIETNIIEIVNKLTERIDFVDSIILINSLAGGTGSGLGSYVNIVLKDYFPTINLFNISVWPHNTGEVVVNSYNTLLSISESYKVSDIMSIINNQEIYDICRDIHKIKKIGFDNLNQIISNHIISTILPTLGTSKELKYKPFSTKSFVSEIIELLGGDPKLKMIRIISTPEIPDEHLVFTNNNWNIILKKGFNLLITNTSEAKVSWNDNVNVKIKSLLALYRGRNLEDITDELSSIVRGNNNKYNLSYDFYEKKDRNEIKNNEKHLTLLSNSNFMSDNLSSTIYKAQNMLMNNAFVHQYEKYGMEKNDFLDSLAFCEQINFDYEHY